MYQTEELENNLDKWIEKWAFIVNNEKELTKVAARIALRQLDVIVTYDFRRRIQLRKGTVGSNATQEIGSSDILI